jgi:ubiquinone/menaquinone biosynthesis C-methylase UbiE
VVTVQPPDPDSLRYARYWEPVLAGPAERMLARVEAAPSRFLDVGAGTGSLLLAAATRWPDASIVALDGSAGMLSVARLRVAKAWPKQAARFEWLIAEASAMPLADRSIDVASVAFVLELVDDRRALLQEIARVLRPGGVLGLVTTMAHELVSGADQAFAALVDEWGMAPETAGFRTSRGSEYQSPDEAEAELTAAGFTSIDVRSDQLQHAWTAAQYLHFKEQYDERDVFESLGDAARTRFRRALRQRWAALPAAAFELRGPLLQALARRPER